MTATDKLLETLTLISRRAGDAILDIYSGAIDVTIKEDDSPLTQADLASHRIIRDALLELTPDWPLLSEESVDIPAQVRRAWDTYWLVDPLDGTKEFINRNDFAKTVINLPGESACAGHRPAPWPLSVAVRMPIRNWPAAWRPSVNINW
jgi:3'-phosphoadenosine 5'-phosphosulfate (PAPS) 3'-phosphatase